MNHVSRKCNDIEVIAILERVAWKVSVKLFNIETSEDFSVVVFICQLFLYS